MTVAWRANKVYAGDQAFARDPSVRRCTAPTGAGHKQSWPNCARDSLEEFRRRVRHDIHPATSRASRRPKPSLLLATFKF